MSKTGKILSVVVAVVLFIVVGGIFGLHYVMDNAGALKIENIVSWKSH